MIKPLPLSVALSVALAFGCGQHFSLGETQCVPSAEVCADGVDNDCNGETDEPACREWPGRPLPGVVVGMAAGDFHTCAWLDDGRAFCWGLGMDGQLGDGTRVSHSFPIAVAGLGGSVVGMTAGLVHTCAWLEGGAARCWGNNDYGQLGDGSRTGSVLPKAVALFDIAGVTAGREHTCAWTGAGDPYCWGRNSFEQLGSADPGMAGPGANRPTPGLVEGVGPVDSMAAGGFHTCVRRAGQLWCWGNNDAGQIATGFFGYGPLPPSPIALGDVVGVSASRGGSRYGARLSAGHNCAWVADGRTWCWGDNIYNQASGYVISYATPLQVLGLTGAVSVVGGGTHTCAVRDDGGVACWGEGMNGQLGTGEVTTGHVTPMDVVDLVDVVGVTVGNSHSCAWDLGGRAFCWGRSFEGQLGRTVLGPGFLAQEVGR